VSTVFKEESSQGVLTLSSYPSKQHENSECETKCRSGGFIPYSQSVRILVASRSTDALSGRPMSARRSAC